MAEVLDQASLMIRIWKEGDAVKMQYGAHIEDDQNALLGRDLAIKMDDDVAEFVAAYNKALTDAQSQVVS